MEEVGLHKTRDWDGFDEFVRERMRRSRLPGVSLAVVRDGELAHARGYGFRDLGRRLPASASTIYGIGSISKSFTALAILKLSEEGILSLDDPVERFLPLRIRPRGEPIRISHLLSHTSGLPALGYAEAEIRFGQGTGGRYVALSTVEDFLAWLNDAEDWVEGRPGERWLYLNEGYIVLGGIVEKLTGQAFSNYVRREILEPLGMRETGFLGEDLGPERAVPYIIPSEGEPKEGKVLPIPIGSDGGLASTAVDMANYLRLFLRKGDPLIAAKGYEEMVTPRVSLPHVPAPFSDASQGSYAYGLMVQPFCDRTLIGHGGSVLVYTAYMGYLPEEGLGVAVLANGSGYPCAQLAQAALAWAMGLDIAELSCVRLDELGDALSGTYATYRDTMRISVRSRGGVLELTMDDREAPQTVTLTLQEMGKEEVRCLAHVGDRQLPVVFRRGGSQAELLYERYKLRRK